MSNEEKKIARDRAEAYGAELERLYADTHGAVTAAAKDLILMLADLHYLYLEAVADLEAQGLREPYNVSKYNKGSRENKAFAPLLKMQTQKARLLRELRLLPGSRKTADTEDEADVSDLDDY